MTNELIAALGGAVVGAVISGVIGWLLPLLQERRNAKQKLKLFTTALMDDLAHAPQLFDRIKNDWQKTGIVYFEYLIELKERRKIYQQYSDYVLLYPEKLRKQIFYYYLKSDKLIFLLETLQNRFSYLMNQYVTTVNKIKLEYPDIDHTQATELANRLHIAEDQEAIKIKENITEQINEIDKCSKDARDICDKLEKYI
ncbi:hypothetical protein SC029_04700 [Legionella pneumophila serogroup 1]|uniref:hypothetical protein n=1 Tax=Legionella pneumophila TaxID=446 RepID=UPI0004843CB3|nr:hypothetical protein [Legionella pneumophila]VEB32054.1 Uncharacterised protein [Legionella pneumophila]BCZ95813.1 hypothetical protein LEG80045_00690 [Legionella pneumophila]HAT1793480.1 hypothetical protein [Legionella pneumophila]HAT1940337.1 hypothetical protein [Legionella pneumophila]HAT3860270.1 hypothetical protein [Legionella pneumophila]